MNTATVQQPSYFHRNYKNDFPSPVAEWMKPAQRVSLVALPFFSLYKPFSLPISLGMGALRMWSTARQWMANPGAQTALLTAVAAAGLAGTAFAHPLGMLITTISDLMSDTAGFVAALQTGDLKTMLEQALQSLNNALYLGLFFSPSLGIAATSLATQSLIGFYKSHAHFQKGDERLEAIGHLLMAMIRGHQSIRQVQQLQFEKKLEAAKKNNTPMTLPTVNSLQKALTYAGYYANSLSRSTLRSVFSLFKPMPRDDRYWPEVAARTQTVAVAVFKAPFAIGLSVLSAPCLFLASYVGDGRFEWIQDEIPSLGAASGPVHGASHNTCLQDPYSIPSGGVVTPFQPVDDQGIDRITALAEAVHQRNRDFYMGNEFDDIHAQDAFIDLLRKQGFHFFIRDLGSNDPIYNHSGLFIASKKPFENPQFISYAAEHKEGITGWTNRGALRVIYSGIQFINVHLNSGDGVLSQVARNDQMNKYVRPLFDQHNHSVVAGDFNFDTGSIDKTMTGLQGLTNALEGQETCSDEGKGVLLGRSQVSKEKIDAVAYAPEKVLIQNAHVTQLRSTTGTDLSDHYMATWDAQPR